MLKRVFSILFNYFATIIFIFLISVTTFSYLSVVLTSNDVLKPVLSSMLLSQLPDKDFGELQSKTAEECKGKPSIELSISDTESIDIKCSDVSTKEGFKQAFADAFFDRIYYGEYDCNFLDCFSKYPFQSQNGAEGIPRGATLILSKKMNDITKKVFIILVSASVILLVIISLFWGLRKTARILIGMGIVSLSFFFFKQGIIQMSQGMPVEFTNLVIEKVSRMSLLFSLIFISVGVLVWLISKLGAWATTKQQRKQKRQKRGKK